MPSTNTHDFSKTLICLPRWLLGSHQWVTFKSMTLSDGMTQQLLVDNAALQSDAHWWFTGLALTAHYVWHWPTIPNIQIVSEKHEAVIPRHINSSQYNQSEIRHLWSFSPTSTCLAHITRSYIHVSTRSSMWKCIESVDHFIRKSCRQISQLFEDPSARHLLQLQIISRTVLWWKAMKIGMIYQCITHHIQRFVKLLFTSSIERVIEPS